jgi:hypothetical protein
VTVHFFAYSVVNVVDEVDLKIEFKKSLDTIGQTQLIADSVNFLLTLLQCFL